MEAFDALRRDNELLRKEMREEMREFRAEMRADMRAFSDRVHTDLGRMWVAIVATYGSFIAAFVATQV